MMAASIGSSLPPSVIGGSRAWRWSRRSRRLEMASAHDKNGRPIVVVTGMGVITSLGAGKADNWAKLTAGQSGIHRITRFANEGLKTTIAGTVDFVPAE